MDKPRDTEERKAVKSNTRKDKWRYFEDFIGNHTAVYQMSKIVCGKLKIENVSIKSKGGKMFTTEAEQKNKGPEHFKEGFNRCSPTSAPDI